MTYQSRGRSIFEVTLAATFLGFITGFVAVLCIGNYFRAKRAMERQKQRRLANIAARNGNGQGGIPDSPRSQYSGSSSQYSDRNEQQQLLGGKSRSQISHRHNLGVASRSNPAPIILDSPDLLDSVPQQAEAMGVNTTYRTQHLNPQRRRQGQKLPFREKETESLLFQDEDQQETSSDVMSV
mmetsp:Transcript_7814/g.10455  ORF Transcript_7814/g.10455 Transcript_7814/m.10455 type:complete len:182 (-) Transcript_7814:611-1156(-)